MTLIAVAIVIIALSLSGCVSSRKIVNSEMAVSHEETHLDVDSMVSVVETWQTPVKVPMSSVSLTLNLDTLHKLPPGAGYMAKQGQANVKVTRIAPTENNPERLVVESSCDSLELVCTNYSKTISTLKRQLQSAENKNSEMKEVAEERYRNMIRFALLYIMAGVLTGAFITMIICYKNR